MHNDFWGNKRLRKFSNNSEKNFTGTRVLIAMGSLAISGGTNLILQYAKALKDSGADVTIGYMLGHGTDITWHPTANEFGSFSLRDCEDKFYDLVITTWWPTVYELPKLNFSRAVYFVQSLESRFALNYGDTESEVKAAATYTFGLPMITVASWLQNLLIAETGDPVWFIKNGVDKNIFPLVTTPRVFQETKRRVLVEGVLGVEMKAVDQTIDAIRSISGIELWHVTPEKSGGSASADRVLEKVSFAKMHEVYESVDIFVKMSRVEGMFGPPLEAFHAGTTGIYSNVTGADEYIVDGVNGLIVEVDDFPTMINKLERLLNDPGLLGKLSANALATAASWPSISQTAQEFVAACYSAMHMSQDSTRTINRIQEFEGTLNRTIKSGENILDLVPPSLIGSE